MANSVCSNTAGILVHFHIGRDGRFRNQGHKAYVDTVKNLADCFGESFVISEDENGNVLPDQEWRLVDGGGNVILQGREAIESPVGVLDWDGEYDTDVVRYLSECSDDEYQLIIDAFGNGEYVDEDVIGYACQATDQLHAKHIRFTEDGGVDVETQYENVHLMPGDYADLETAKEKLELMGFIEKSVERISCALEGEGWF